MKKARYIYYPVVIALLLIAGIYIGIRLKTFDNYNQQLFSIKAPKFNKVNEVMNYIQQEYVDTVNNEQLSDNAIRSILDNLDPHSGYISRSELASVNEPLEGNFDGIGIEFNIMNDTIYVITPIAGGPSEMLGIQAGDKIIKVDDKLVAGVKISNKEVFGKLRGKSGTKVKVSVLRRGQKKLIDFSITRGKIPIYSVDVAYMLNENIGFIKVSRFAGTTYKEFMKAANELKLMGMKKLVVDLRGNPGGYLNEASEMADEFIEDGKLIVYTEGRSRPKEEYRATKKGSFEKSEVVVLVDEGSASASEILAGALQDNDRGTIIGRRTFGKGLVQEQSEFPDGSAIRLTIARYYTPTGRCIQKPYEKGKAEDYYDEEMNRFRHGEFTNADSVKLDKKQKFTTPKGKVVYGGGGIMPDIFVPIDTNNRSVLFTEFIFKGIFNQFAIKYADENRASLKTFGKFENFRKGFVVSDKLISDLLAYAEKEGIKIKGREKELAKSKDNIRNQIKASIARMMWQNTGFYPITYEKDKMIEKAMEVLR